MTPLGLVVGRMLGRHAPQAAGSAVLGFQQLGERAVTSRLFWRSADVWRVERRNRVVLADGHNIVEQSTGRPPLVMPPRPGHPAWDLQLVFPLRAPIWGRIGDDYYLVGTEDTDVARVVRVLLAGTEDDRSGWVDVDMSTGCIVAADYHGLRLWLDEFKEGPFAHGGPLPDSLFQAPHGHG